MPNLEAVQHNRTCTLQPQRTIVIVFFLCLRRRRVWFLCRGPGLMRETKTKSVRPKAANTTMEKVKNHGRSHNSIRIDFINIVCFFRTFRTFSSALRIHFNHSDTFLLPRKNCIRHIVAVDENCSVSKMNQINENEREMGSANERHSHF